MPLEATGLGHRSKLDGGFGVFGDARVAWKRGIARGAVARVEGFHCRGASGRGIMRHTLPFSSGLTGDFIPMIWPDNESDLRSLEGFSTQLVINYSPSATASRRTEQANPEGG